MDDLVRQARHWAENYRLAWTACDCEDDDCPHGMAMVAWKMSGSEVQMVTKLSDAIEALQARIAEAERRRDEWRKKAEGYDAIRLALREKVGSPWPPHLSRVLWAGIAADEKKRADDAEAQIARLTSERDAAYERAAEVAESLPSGDFWEKRIAAAIRAMKEE